METEGPLLNRPMRRPKRMVKNGSMRRPITQIQATEQSRGRIRTSNRDWLKYLRTEKKKKLKSKRRSRGKVIKFQMKQLHCNG